MLHGRRRLVKKGGGFGVWGGPWSKRAPGGFGVWGAVLQEAPGQKGPLVVLGFGAGSSKRPLVKGPLMVLEARARTP